jgi:Effector Associated Constant Component 1
MLPSLRVEIGGDPGMSAEELAQLSVWLRDELLKLDLDAVEEAASGPPPRGAKGSAADAVGTLIVTLSNSAVLVALAGVLRSWVSRGKGRKVTLRLGADMIEVSEASAEDQARLIASWMDHHAGQ